MVINTLPLLPSLPKPEATISPSSPLILSLSRQATVDPSTSLTRPMPQTPGQDCPSSASHNKASPVTTPPQARQWPWMAC